jgi:phthalate 4,5-cis-dihydrodiol dehydrogenase
MAPALANPKIAVVAGADPRLDARSRFAAEYSGRTYSTVEDLCDDSQVEAIYVATPHQFHAEHVRTAARRGKHVLVEKPMALSGEECRAMISEAANAGVQLVVGHSHSFDLPVRRARELIVAGGVGPLRMITAVNFTDFLYRPRRSEELRTESGGGVIFNQAPHQVDVARLLAGSRVISVRALAGAWDRARPTEGAYSCLLTFENGAFASLTYNGYAHLDTDEWMDWIAESGLPKNPADYGSARALLKESETRQQELVLKNARNYGGAEAPAASPNSARWHQHFGILIASCERADLRPMPNGITIFGDEARSFDALPRPSVPRAEVIDEFYDAVRCGIAPLHDGDWGRATMEVCSAMLQSARSGRDIRLDD